MKSHRGRRLLLRLLVLVCLAAGSGFAIRQYRHSHAALNLPTAAARRGPFSVLVNCRGALTARRSVQLISPLDVEDLQIVWLAPAGTEVKVGAPIVRFDPSRLRQELKEKTAALQQAQATLDQTAAQAQITVDQDKLDLSTDSYAAQKAKLEASKQSIVSAIEGEKSTIDLGLAEEKVKVRQASSELHKSSDSAKMASQSRLRDEAQAEVGRTQSRLGRMELSTPVGGLITYLPNRSQGWMNAQPFKVGDHVSSGQALADIPDADTLEMESKVDEVDRGRIALNASVLVHVDALPETTFQATLVAISPLTEQSFTEWPPTRSFRAYAHIKDKNPRLRPGMNAGADIVQTRIPDAISIPAKALFTANGKPVVYLKRETAYVQTPVRVTARNTDEIAIEGIAASAVVALVEPEKAQ
jgi:HlyD family secretion protein